MRFLSLFSGIEAASVAWLPLGWECVAVAEIEKFPSAVLAHHYPEVPNLGDITKITKDRIEALGQIDLVVGGFPCQDLSIAGKRKGLRDEDGNYTRSGLFFDAMRIVRWANPRYLLLENVPGIYSSNKGRDFTSVVGEVLGVEFAVPTDGWRNTGVAASDRGLFEWATLDAQWFGVPQRRRRMFALADFGDWRSRPPVLFEFHSLSGNPAPSREKGENVAPTLDARAGRSGETSFATSGGLIPSTGDIAHCLNAGGMGRQDYETETLITHSFALQHAQIGRKDSAGPQGKGWQEDVSFTLDSRPCADVVAYRTAGDGAVYEEGDRTAAITTGTDPCANVVAFAQNTRDEQTSYIRQSMQVRRLTPLECARLQGFSDDYLDITFRGKPAADGPKYKALGNSFAVPVVRWIGEQIQMVEEIRRVA